MLNVMKERGVATLMATHDLFHARATGTHIGIMKGGQLLTTFPTGDITNESLQDLYLQYMND